MEIVCLTVGEIATNCYLVSDESSREALIIDPGEEGDFISTNILENKLIPKAILLTHGHFDHCLAVLDLKLNFDIPIYLHQKDLFLYEKAHLSAKHFSGITSPKLPPIDHFLTDNQMLTFGRSSLKVIHTPGHTPGSICLLSQSSEIRDLPDRQAGPKSNILLTGDTLFADGVGRTDLSYSSDLQRSIGKLSKIPVKSTIYPGHGDPTDLRFCQL